LGSYSWTVLTVNALLAYPKQEQIPSLEAFLAFFFKWYALYDWKEVVALTRVGKAYKAHKRDKMPIMTSIEPCFNSAKNVTRSTFKRIKAELNRAHNLTKKTPHESNWDTLFDKAELVGKGSDFCLEIRIESIDDKILTQSVGWLEGNIVGLFAELEKDANLILEFLPTLAYQAQSAVFKTFIYFENTEKQILEGVLNDFLQKFGGQATMIGKIL
jgi:poly(A) polymerase Pap1